MNAKERAAELFRETYGASPEGVVSAPGRVNLIGDHTDYTGGLVLPAALNLETALAYRRLEGEVRATSEASEETVAFRPGDEGVEGWGAYLAGTAWALRGAGCGLSGLELSIASDVPTGSGLSSSAALEVASARVWREVDGLALSDVDIAKLCKRAENDYVGVPSGIMDQFSSSVPRPGEAILLDCRSFDYRVLAVPEAWCFVVIDSNAPRTLSGSAYAERVAECREVADILGLGSLRELEPEGFRDLYGNLLKRARHVYHENRRVEEAAEVLDTGNAVAFGSLMTQSHVSLRDDYEVSSPALDRLVEASLVFEACYGARLTGAGFGGCVVALVDTGDKEAFCEHLLERVSTARVVASIC